jgi:hypothetical protein
MKTSGVLAFACLLAAASLPTLTGSVSGAVTYAGDQPGPIRIKAAQTLAGNKVLKLDGDGDSVGVPSLLDLSGSEITIQYWFKGNSVQSAVRQQSGGWIVAGWNKIHILSHDGGIAGIAMGDAVTDGGRQPCRCHPERSRAVLPVAESVIGWA